MQPQEWDALSFPDQTREIKADVLRPWLIHLYPAGIRTADQVKPVQKFTGSLKLEPAGTDKDARYALLQGNIGLSKESDEESAFEGTFQAVVTYRRDGPEVRTGRAVVAGDYVYRMRGTQRIPLRVAIESRPDRGVEDP
jgi:hypothetical protein